jgi:hypothetical protein
VKRWLPLIALLLAPQRLVAQAAAPAPAPKTYDEMWRIVAQRIVAERSVANNLALPLRVGQIIRLQSNYTPFLLYVKAKDSVFGLLGDFQEARTDKQVGAPANTSGGTSLVSKGAVPSILGFAVENGALTQSATDSAVTLRGTLVGWLDLVRTHGFIDSYDDDAAIIGALRAVSYSLSLDTSTAVEESDEDTGPGLNPIAQFNQIGKQLTSYSVRVAVWDQRDPRRKANREKVGQALLDKGIAINTSLNFLDPLLNSDEYEQWLFQSQYMLAAPGLSENEVLRILGRQIELLRQMALARVPDLTDHVEVALRAFSSYNKARLDVFNSLQHSPLVTIEYVANRLDTLPNQRVVRLVAEGQWGPRLDLTGNLAWTFQEREEAESAQLALFRDFQASVQAEIPLGKRSSTSSAGSLTKPSVAFAYLTQDVKEDAAVSFAGKSYLVAPGRIHVAQAKVTIPAKGSGLKVPLSVSWSNRTELVQESHVRAQIGVTWDFDAFTAGFLKK